MGMLDDLLHLTKQMEDGQRAVSGKLACRLDTAEKELRRLGAMAGFGLDQMQESLELLVEQGMKARAEVAADLVRVSEDAGTRASDEWCTVLQSVRQRRSTDKARMP